MIPIDSLIKSIMSLFEFIILIAIIIVGIGAYCYNSLQKLGQVVKSSNATVLTVIQKRMDLINKLMDIAKGYGEHEKLIHIKISENLTDTFKASSIALSTVNAIAQNYPNLKADATYKDLMLQIANLEHLLQQKRQQYNYAVERYNTQRLQLPSVLFAKLLGFHDAPYFDLDNMQDIKDFTTDDGQLLRDILSKASSKAVDIGKKGISIAQEKLNKNTKI